MIQQKVIDYIDRCLSSSGFAVLSARVAFRLDVGRWATLTGCGFDFSSIYSPVLPGFVQARGARIFVCDVEDSDQPVRVIARTDHALEERLLHVAGLRATNIRPWTPEPPAAEAPKPAAPAADEPPSWPCLARSKWFESKGLPDPMDDRNAKPGVPTNDVGVFAGRKVEKARF